MQTLDELVWHLRDNGVAVSHSQYREVKNLGYYHGYKGYRFVGTAKNQLPLTDFAQVATLNDFDMALKSLIYPRIMFVETALKNYTLEAVLSDADSESFDQIYAKSLTAYRSLQGTRGYKPALLQRMRLKNEIDALLAQRYRSSVPVIQHFLDDDEAVPIWALFEVMTLGTFGVFYRCLDERVKNVIIAELGMPSNYDSASVLGDIIFTLKDLRNAIAHNGVIMDVRFKQASVSRDIGKLLAGDAEIKFIDFGEITDYIVLLSYLMAKLQSPKNERIAFLDDYIATSEKHQRLLPQQIFSRLIHTNARQKVSAIQSIALS